MTTKDNKEAELLEESLVKLESTANFLRGMAMFDKRLPKDIAESCMNKVVEIDIFTDNAQLLIHGEDSTK